MYSVSFIASAVGGALIAYCISDMMYSISDIASAVGGALIHVIAYSISNIAPAVSRVLIVYSLYWILPLLWAGLLLLTVYVKSHTRLIPDAAPGPIF